MQIGCTELSPITLGIIFIEILFIGAHGVYYLERPVEKERLEHLFFITFLLIFNIADIHLPNPLLNFPLYLQYVLKNGIGFPIITYLTFKFFRNKKIGDHKFHCKRALLLVVLPYPFFFTLLGAYLQDLERAHHYAFLFPIINNLIIVSIVGKIIIKCSLKNEFNINTSELILLSLTIVMLLVLYPAIYWKWEKTVVPIFINLGPTLLNVFLLYNRIKIARLEQINLRDIVLLSVDQQAVNLNCQIYMFSKRETEIAVLLLYRLKRQQIADKLFISVRTVDKHIERIFSKTGVSAREQLFEKLNRIS